MRFVLDNAMIKRNLLNNMSTSFELAAIVYAPTELIPKVLIGINFWICCYEKIVC